MRYRESPEPAKTPDGSAPPGDKVMHMAFMIGGSLIMASDGFCSGKPNFSGFSLSYPAADKADAKKRFDALAAGGKVTQPLTETFFADAFGMVTDKFGLSWQVIPTPLFEMLSDKDPAKTARVTNAFLKMKKFDIEKLRQAFEGRE